MNDILEWDKLKSQLAKIKVSEILLRKRIFGHFFAEAENGEGTFYSPLGNDYKLKAVAKLDRTIDIAHFGVMKEKFIELKISVDTIVKYKPDLEMKVYKTLTEKQRQIFDSVLTIKPGAPTLEIVAPKEVK